MSHKPSCDLELFQSRRAAHAQGSCFTYDAEIEAARLKREQGIVVVLPLDPQKPCPLCRHDPKASAPSCSCVDPTVDPRKPPAGGGRPGSRRRPTKARNKRD